MSYSADDQYIVLSAAAGRWGDALATARGLNTAPGTLVLVSVPLSGAQLARDIKSFSWDDRARLGVEAVSPDMRGYVKVTVARDRLERSAAGGWVMSSHQDQEELSRYSVGCVVPTD